MTDEPTEGLGRRDLLKRGAILGGTLVWTAPAVQSLAGPAFAQGSPADESCDYRVILQIGGSDLCAQVTASTSACCAKLNEAITNPTPDPLTAILNALLSAECRGFGSVTTC